MTTIPHNAQAEADVVGAMLVSDTARADCLSTLTSGDFYDPRCSATFGAFERLHAKGSAVDAAIVAAESGVPREWLLSTLAVPYSTHSNEYAQIVARDAWLRRVQSLIGDVARAIEANEVDQVEKLLRAGQDELAPSSEADAAPHMVELLDRTYTHRWLVPDLLERRDRVMLTGGEGKGKSLLLRQTAVRLAAGIHPFEDDVRVQPAYVLLVDLENSEEQVQRSLRLLGSCARKVTDRVPSLWVQCRPQGMDLTQRSDVRWLDRLLAHHKPDVLVFGSLYKAYRASGRRAKHSEESAELVAAALDDLRVKHDCALFIEAHAGHGDQNDRNGWRPFGASLFLRWPEFGFGLKPNGERKFELADWRGMRERGRRWPYVLREGSNWPWEVEAS